MRFLSARLSDFTGAEYCHVIGEIGTDFYFDLRLPRSTYQGQYVQEGCGGFCGYLSPSVPLVADDCPAVTGNTLAVAVDNEGHVTTVEYRRSLGSQQRQEPYHLRLDVGAPAGPRFQGAHRRLLRPRSRLLVLRRVLRWRARSAHRGPALSARFQRDPGRGAGEHSVGAARRGRKLEHPGQHRTRRSRDPHLGEAPGAPCGRGAGMWPGAGIHTRSPDLQFLPIEHRMPRPGHQFLPYRGAGPGRDLALSRPQPTRLDSPSIRAASPTARSSGGRLGSSNHRAIGTGPRTHSTYQFAINFLRYLAYQTDPPSSYSLSQFQFSLVELPEVDCCLRPLRRNGS